MSRKKKIILMVGHGSRVERSNQEFEAFVHNFEGCFTEHEFRHGYVELARPLLKDALDEAASRADEVLVLPLFLLTAGHIKQDISGAVDTARDKFPQVIFHLAGALGVHSNMIQLVAKRLEAAARGLNGTKKQAAVLMIGRGSSDLLATSDFYKIAHLVQENTDYGRVACSFIAVVDPEVQEVLEELIQKNPKIIILQPYLLFHGLLVNRLKELIARYSKLYPHISIRLSRPLGEDSLIFDVLKERVSDVARTK